jgi:uncharacterized protein
VQSIVVDTGPLVAWFNPNDRDHDRAERWLRRNGPRFARHTTLACVTEALHLLDEAAGQWALLDWIGAGGAALHCVHNEHLGELALRMRRYGSTPMDFADATVLWLADCLDTHSILTLDERGFSVFRLSGGRKPILELQKDLLGP